MDDTDLYWLNKYVVNRRTSTQYDVYIGKGSKWYNPFVEKRMSLSRRIEIIEQYERYLYTSGLINDIHELKGKILGCYCYPLACHGMVLARLANRGEEMAEKKVESPIKETHFMHSWYNRKVDAVIVKLRRLHEDGTTSPEVKVFPNPQRSIYITKMEHRNHEYKLEREELHKLDRVTVTEKDKLKEIARLLGLPSKPFYRKDEVLASPYIYGANIEIESLIKMEYLKRIPGEPLKPAVGFLDVENDIDTKELSLISFLSHTKTVYTAVLNRKMWKTVDNNKVKVTPEEMETYCNTKLKEYLVRENFTKLPKKIHIPEYDIKFGFCDTVQAMLIFIFKAIREEQCDFIGTWSDHDVQMIIRAINKETNFSCADFFTDPKVEKKYRGFLFDDGERSMKESSHWTHRWSWVNSTCSSQFLNLMAVYSMMRKTAPFRDSYKLDDVLKDHIGSGKFPKISDNHKEMADNFFMEYTAYNIFDVIGLDLLEMTTNDVTGFSIGSGVSPVRVFNLAVAMTHNDLYDTQIKEGHVLSCPSNNDKYNTFNQLFSSTGGTVLPPYMYDGPSVEIS